MPTYRKLGDVLVYFLEKKCSKSQKYLPKNAMEFLSFGKHQKGAAYYKANGKTSERNKGGCSKIMIQDSEG